MTTAVKQVLPEIRNPFSKRVRIYAPHDDQSMTKQSFADECNINNIMAKYQKTGAVAHLNKHEGRYGFATSADFTESMRIVTEAQELFNELPSSIRRKFGNSPESFLDFAQDPSNIDEMIDMGLATQEATEARNAARDALIASEQEEPNPAPNPAE